MAQKWADYLADIDSFDNNIDGGVGENLYASYYGWVTNGNDANDAWYSQIKN
jgi:hypothetical protein